MKNIITSTLITMAVALSPGLARADPGSVTLGLAFEPPAPALFLDAQQSSELQLETTIFGLPRNIGDGERVARGVIAAALIGLGVYGLASENFSDTTSAVLLGVSAVPASTAATGYCPLYHLLGTDTLFFDF